MQTDVPWHYLCADSCKLITMRTFRLFLTITVLSLASLMQLQAQALYRPKPDNSSEVPYYPGIRAVGSSIVSDDYMTLSSLDAQDLLKSLYPREYRTSRVQNVIGCSLFYLGIPTTIGGLLCYVAALAAPKDEYGPFSFTSGWGGAGTYCTVGGIMAVAGGIILLRNAEQTVGKMVDDYHATYKPKSELSLRPTSSGVGLVFSF